MANPGPRMFTVSRALEQALLRHFVHQKLEIAYAINKPFPFFESLRDKSLIPERMYMESLEACRNLVPISKVVHNILTKLEKTFNLSLLVTLFNQINLCEYPNLRTILRSFINVGTAYGEWSRATPTPLRVPADPEEGSSLETLLQLPPPQSPPPRLLFCAHTVHEARASLEQVSESPDQPSGPSAPHVPLPGLILGEGSAPVASDSLASNTKTEEDSQEMPSLPPCPEQVIQDASSEPKDPAQPQEVPRTSPKQKGKKRRPCIWSTPRKRRKKREAAPTGHGVQEKPQAVEQRKDPSSNSKVVSRTQETRAKCAQKSRSAENPKENTVDFRAPTLPVSCGKAKGILYRQKMEQEGTSGKSIQNEKGAWISLKEFIIEGQMERSKNWKRSIRCGGKTLEQLIMNGILHCPPMKNLKRRANSS